MRVIYEEKNDITEKVEEAILIANSENEIIEKIVLSKEDFAALYTDNYSSSPSGRGCPSKNVGNYSPFRYKGVLIEVEGQKEDKPADSLEEISPEDLEQGVVNLLSVLFGDNK